KQQDLLRSLALEARVHDFSDLRRRVLHAIRSLARIHELDLAAQRGEARGDQPGGAVQAFEVAAPGLDRDELLQCVEERLALLLCEREQGFHRLRSGGTRHGGREESGGTETSNERAHGTSFRRRENGILSGGVS